MVFEATITKTDGSQVKYDLRSRSNLGDANPTKIVVLFFDNGDVYKGYTDGTVDEDFEFCLKVRLDDKFSAALPFNRLMGWAYEDDGCHKDAPLWRRLLKRSWFMFCLFSIA